MTNLREHLPKVPLSALCKLFGKSRQAWYGACAQTERQAAGAALALQIAIDERREHPRMGARKLFHIARPQLEAAGVKLGRDAFFDLLREEGLLVGRKRAGHRTTNSNHYMRKYDNLIAGTKPRRVSEVWVSDLTYLHLQEGGFAYLSLVTDAYSHMVIGWALASSLGLEGCLAALQQALGTRRGEGPLVHHSDRGVQYCSHAYVELLRANGVAISMAEAGNPYENAIAERMNGILKQEYGLGGTFANADEARRAAAQAVRLYNEKRPHLSLGMHTPAEVHAGGVREFAPMWKKRARPAAGSGSKSAQRREGGSASTPAKEHVSVHRSRPEQPTKPTVNNT